MLQRAGDSSDAIVLRERRLVPRDAAAAAAMMIEDLPAPARLAERLAPLLRDLLATERLAGRCVEQTPAADRAPSHPPKLIAFGLCGFLSDDLANELVERPTANFALNILERCARDETFSGLLDAAAIGKANAGQGLTLFPFCWLQRPRDKSTPLGAELATHRMTSFIIQIAGHNLQRILREDSPEQAPVVARSGLLRLKACPGATPDSAGERVIFGLTREQARNEAYGSAMALLFLSARPRLAFTRIQQHVLQCAVDDLSDEGIARHLNISTHAVNMRWRTIYERVQEEPDLAALVFGNRGGATTQKRRRVTAYVRAHPEELRPFAR